MYLKTFWVAFLVILGSSQAFAGRRVITCVNPLTEAELTLVGDDKDALGNLTMNSELANIFVAKGIKNAWSVTGVGDIDWEDMTFSETSLYGETLYFRRDSDANGGKHRFIFISQQYEVYASFLFNEGECHYIADVSR